MTPNDINKWRNPRYRTKENAKIFAASKANFRYALTYLGIETDFSIGDLLQRLLAIIPEDGCQIVISADGDEAKVCPWNTDSEFIWSGYFNTKSKDKPTNMKIALAMLILCIKCNPLKANEQPFAQEHSFYLNDSYETENNGFDIEEWRQK